MSNYYKIMNYGAFTNDNEKHEKDENDDILETSRVKETNLRLFTESIFGAFRKDKRYMCVLLFGLLFIAALPFNISLLVKRNQNGDPLTLVENTIHPLTNNDITGNNENNENNAKIPEKTNRPTAFPTYLDEDDDAYTDFYNQYDLRFTTNRDGYDVLSYFLPNASDLYSYKFLKPYTGVIEPYANMWISITDTGDDNADRKYNHKYTICDKNNDCLEDYDAADTSFSYECDPLNDEYSVTLKQYNAFNGEYTGRSSEGKLLCMYVRREFRALTEDDLTKTIDAMYTMWTTDEDTGAALYGDNYHNYVYLLEYHYFNAAWIDADHVHEGLGFLAQHIKMTNIFEKAMQAVEPSISLPYWDYTIETAYNISVWESPMFQENTFGTLTLPNNLTWGWLYDSNGIDDGKIPDGKWANVMADYNTKYDELYTAYGYMRAPWNINPSKYITRYVSIDKDLPKCDSHYTMLEYDSITDFLHQIPYAPHASTHGVVGGVFGCDAMNPLRESGYILSVDGQINLCKNWIFYLKELYRANVLIPPTDCSATNEKGEYSMEKEDIACNYECNDERMDVLSLMLQHSILNSDYECVPVDDMPDEGWDAWIDFICGGDGSKVFGGDHLESASPADPSFWPIHPTTERLLQAKYMAGGFNSDDWPTDAEAEYVCNKVSCYNSDIDDFEVSEECCYGHYQHDQMYDATNNDRDTKVGPTNNDIHEWTNPTKSYYAMPYIYDGFTWEHCNEVELDFDELLTNLYNKYEFNTTTPASEKGW